MFNIIVEGDTVIMVSYRKKPVTIQAYQMTQTARSCFGEWPGWLVSAWNEGVVLPAFEGETNGKLIIKTLEGDHLVTWGDYIIQGVQGELYPCKETIFNMTYELTD